EGEGKGEGEGKCEGEGEGKGEGDGKGDGEDNKGGSGDGTGEEDISVMLEGIYDPVSGEVSYGKVFATYYAEYLAAMKEGKVPPELKDVLDAYFASLTNTKE
ncbi:MAG: hypothetical protein IJY89_06680, partial [Clostridia bacterium]|nr:hypothetical protein [Clostridia bacterium]